MAEAFAVEGCGSESTMSLALPGDNPTRRRAFMRGLQLDILQSSMDWCVNSGIAATTAGNGDDESDDEGDEGDAVEEGETTTDSFAEIGAG